MKHFFGKSRFKTYRSFVGIFVFFSVFLIPLRVFAAPQTVQDHLQGGANTPQTNDAAAPSIASTGWVSAINTILALAILVAIIYFGLKLLNRKLLKQRSASAVQILVQQPLTTNRSIHVVEIAGQLYVLGVGETISCLDKITDEQTKAVLLEKIEQAQNQASFNRELLVSPFQWKDKVFAMLKRNKNQKTVVDGSVSDSATFQETLERQLESLRLIRESIEREQPTQQQTERHDQT